MDNSLKTKEKTPKRGANAPRKGKIKTFLIGKELKTKDLLTNRGGLGKRSRPPQNQNQSRWRGRCATASASAPRLRSSAWLPKGSLPARPHGPNVPLSPHQAIPSDRPGFAVPLRAAKRTLDGEDRSEIIQGFLLCLSIDIFVFLCTATSFFESGKAARLSSPLIEALEAGSRLPLRRHHGIGYFNK